MNRVPSDIYRIKNPMLTVEREARLNVQDIVNLAQPQPPKPNIGNGTIIESKSTNIIENSEACTPINKMELP